MPATPACPCSSPGSCAACSARSAPPSSRPQPPSTIFDDSPTRACATAAATRCLVVRRYPPNQYPLLGLVVPVDRDSQDQRSTVIPGQICLSALARDGGDVRRSEGLDLADSVLDVGRLDDRLRQERHLESVPYSAAP